MIPDLAFIPPNNVVETYERLTKVIRSQHIDETYVVLDYFW